MPRFSKRPLSVKTKRYFSSLLSDGVFNRIISSGRSGLFFRKKGARRRQVFGDSDPLSKRARQIIAEGYALPDKQSIKNSLIRGEILKTLFRTAKDRKDIQFFRDALRYDSDPFNKKYAADVLRIWGDKRAVNPMTKIIMDLDGLTSLRISCARAVFKMGDKTQKQKLSSFLGSKDPLTRELARLVLAKDAETHRQVLDNVIKTFTIAREEKL